LWSVGVMCNGGITEGSSYKKKCACESSEEKAAPTSGVP
jgi:hypothetical protein